VKVWVSIENWGGELREVSEAIDVEVQEIQIYVAKNTDQVLSLYRTLNCDMKFASRELVCNPFELACRISRRTERGVVLSCSVKVMVGEVNAILSLDEIALVQSIMTRITLTDLPPSKLLAKDAYCIFGAISSDKEDQVDLYDVNIQVTVNPQ
jgi:hypothetical protein